MGQCCASAARLTPVTWRLPCRLRSARRGQPTANAMTPTSVMLTSHVKFATSSSWQAESDLKPLSAEVNQHAPSEGTLPPSGAFDLMHANFCIGRHFHCLKAERRWAIRFQIKPGQVLARLPTRTHNASGRQAED